MKLKVLLNGTKENPWLRLGVTQNPFPQIARAEYSAACLRLQKLGGDPIPNVEYIRETLVGFTPEFVALCCKNFKPGQMVAFTVNFPEAI